MSLFRRRAAHQELAAGNRHHLELHVRARHLLDVGPHAGRVGGLGLGDVEHRFGQPLGRGPGEQLCLGLGELLDSGLTGSAVLAAGWSAARTVREAMLAARPMRRRIAVGPRAATDTNPMRQRGRRDGSSPTLRVRVDRASFLRQRYNRIMEISKVLQ